MRIWMIMAFTALGSFVVNADDAVTNLGGGIVTRTDVDAYADLSLDLRDMRENSNSDAVLRLYDEGRNAELSPGYYLRLKDLSDTLYGSGGSGSGNTNSPLTPNYFFQIYGLSNEGSPTTHSGSSLLGSSGLTSTASTSPPSSFLDSHYDNFKISASNIIKSTASNYGNDGYNNDGHLNGAVHPTEAIIALNMWMYATHLLQWGVNTCAKQSEADNRDVVQAPLVGGGFDEFIAFWIGTGQKAGSSTDGHGLYAWAQEIGEQFRGTSMSSQEVNANYQLKLFYQQGAQVLSFANACSKQSDLNMENDRADRSKRDSSVQQLWIISNKIISYMFVPLFQSLVKAITDEDRDRVALYSNALVPQLSQCRPSVFQELKNLLLGGNVDFNQKEKLFINLSEAFECFDLSCDDIGDYTSTIKDKGSYFCQNYLSYDQNSYMSLGGYVPSSDVTAVAKIDLDILQIGLLMSVEETIPFANYLYSYGKNSEKPRDSDNDPIRFLSLHEMATSSERQTADPIYTQFVSYFNDINYADKAVMRAFQYNKNDKRSTWMESYKWTSLQERSTVITATCAYQIVFMYFMANLNDAVTECTSVDPNFDEAYLPLDKPFHPWDEVVALLIGSVEGAQMGGSPNMDDGQLLWNLANSRSFQFQTNKNQINTGRIASDEGAAAYSYSRVNSELFDLFYAGKGEMDAYDCYNLKITVHHITKLSIVPVMQTLLRIGIMIENTDETSEYLDNELALGETMAYSILPILEGIDKNSAEIVKENFIGSSSKNLDEYMKDGLDTVADSLGSALVEWGTPCQELGQTSQVKPCRSVGSGPLAPVKRPAKGSNDDNSSADGKFGGGWTWSLPIQKWLQAVVPSNILTNDKKTLLLYSVAGIIGSSTFLLGCLNCCLVG